LSELLNKKCEWDGHVYIEKYAKFYCDNLKDKDNPLNIFLNSLQSIYMSMSEIIPDFFNLFLICAYGSYVHLIV
jgi:hypothetical protein